MPSGGGRGEEGAEDIFGGGGDSGGGIRSGVEEDLSASHRQGQISHGQQRRYRHRDGQRRKALRHRRS